MTINIDFLKTELINTAVEKPRSGTLSGHAAGEPFDRHVYAKIKQKYPDCTFRQFEFLNALYSANPKSLSLADRRSLIKNPTVAFLLNRGKKATEAWTVEKQIEERQNDTADILVFKDGCYNIIDVKTTNASKKAQPPNIISAYKLAQMCSLILSSDEPVCHAIIYVGVVWELDKDSLICKGVSIKELFKTDPSNLYINWAAAMQIQFHVSELEQDFSKDIKIWCKEYLAHFVNEAESRSKFMINKFVTPFKRFLE